MNKNKIGFWEAIKILRKFINYMEYEEELGYSEEQIINALEYFTPSGFILKEDLKDELNRRNEYIKLCEGSNNYPRQYWKDKGVADYLETLLKED